MRERQGAFPRGDGQPPLRGRHSAARDSLSCRISVVILVVVAIVDHGIADVSGSPARTSARRSQYRPVPIWGSCRRRGR